MSTTVVHLVRHGEVFNPDKVLYGRLPGFRLSDAGEEMARAAGRWFAGRDVVSLRSSPLERAVQTATLLGEAAGFGPEAERGVDDRVIESASAFEGTAGGWKDPRNLWLLRDPFTPSWGEPYADIARRMRAAVADARDAAEGHEGVVVSHQLPIEIARRSLQGRRLWHRPDRRQCALASVTSFVYDGTRLADVTYAEPAGSSGRTVAGA